LEETCEEIYLTIFCMQESIHSFFL
jgi:hypothetical protein